MKYLSLVPLLAVLATAPAFAANDDDPRGDHPDAPPRSPEEERASFHLPPGFEIQLVASEPEIDKPINLTFDGAGRLWVSGSKMYPWPAGTDAAGKPIPNFAKTFADITNAFHSGPKAPEPVTEARDTIRVLSDFDATGHARTVSLFADGLNIPSGLQPLPRKPGEKGDTVIAYSIPGIWRLKDDVGDGKAHIREPLFETFGFLDTHGGSSSYLYWIDGWIYGTHGFRNHSEVRDGSGKVTVLDSGNTYRFRPDGSHFEIYSHGQTNPFGLSVTPLGDFFTADSHSRPVYMVVRGGWYEGIGKQNDGLGFGPRVTNDGHGSTAIAGMVYYAAEQFPEEYRGNTFNGNVVTQKINRDKIEWHGSTPQAVRMPDFLTCDDPWFRPVNVKQGPDGALYVADFYNPVIGHYEFPLTDPRRDHTHGRIWRIVYRGEKLDQPVPQMPDLATLEAAALAEKLADPNLVVRILATQELADRIGPVGEPLLNDFFNKLPIKGPKSPTDSAEALHGGKLSGVAASHATWIVARWHSRDGLPALDKLPHFYGAISPIVTPIVRDSIPLPRPNTALLKGILDDDPDAFDRRALVDALGKRPDPRFLQPLLRVWAEAAADDSALIYATRLALRDNLIAPGGYEEAAKVARESEQAASRLADVSLGAKTPEAAAFLLEYLTHGGLAKARSGEFARHTALYLATDRLPALAGLLGTAANLPLADQLGLAEALSQAARQRGVELPESARAEAAKILTLALASSDESFLKRAIESVRELPLKAKFAPLAAIVADPNRASPLRAAALEAVANLPEARPLLASSLKESSSITVRKRAAELLGQSADRDSLNALYAGLASAPAEVAGAIAASLARTNDGAEALLSAIDLGLATPRLLRAAPVAGALEKRPQPMRDHAASLTTGLPPEDARLDGVIAQRVADFKQSRPNPEHGGEVFHQNCAVCHQIKNQGANVGPALDGIGARGPHRLIEDILDPNRNVDPMFRQTTVETADGRVIAGLNPREEGELLVLTDPTGKAVSVPKSSVKSKTQSSLSLMPPGFETAISPSDFNDLLAYLIKP